MIDTNELRRLAQAATPGPDGVSLSWIRLLRDFQQGASPAAISELLDRLEAAESECLEQARLNGMGSEREAALMAKLEAAEKDIAVKEEVIDSLAAVVKRLDAQCDAAEKERNTLRTTVRHESDCVEAAKAEIKALRAKIEQMERQEPVGVLHVGSYYGEELQDWEFAADQRVCDRLNEQHVTNPTSLKLYALPGAQPQLDEIKIALQRALELGARETWTGARKHRSWEDQREEQQCWNKVWSLLGAQGEEK